ncbi:Mrp/NBP35 family ATP-binding protein, partial [Psychrosphaera haliotis]|nr:Mrp/NBP35 family ATP-binding protein [Psychrosphaera haliotis]
KYDVALNSIGFLVPADKATIWRGPMASRALMQLVNETNWPELDILFVDMPPGTGDIQLTMSEQIKCHGAIIVTTPQNIALADAQKGIEMFQKVNTPILGVVENMSQFTCPDCGASHTLFGAGGGSLCAEKHKIPLLAQLSLKPEIRNQGDIGKPFSLLDTNNEYQKLVFSLMMHMSNQTEQRILTL